MRFKVVNARKDKRIFNKTASHMHPKNLAVSNTRGGIRM